MRLSLRHALAATTLLMLALGVAVANADPPSTNGKLSYTEVIDDTGSLVCPSTRAARSDSPRSITRSTPPSRSS